MSDFDAMRRRLVDCGLIDADHRVTPAGEHYTAQLIATLKETRIDETRGPTVKHWNTRKDLRR